MRKDVLFLVLAAFVAPVYADVPSECADAYEESGAIPGRSDCPLLASIADFGFNYHCANPDVITEYCGGEPPTPDPGKSNECRLPASGPIWGGNPVNKFVGNKVEADVDFVDPHGRLGFTRHYSSLEIPGNPGSTLGERWRHGFQYSLLSYDDDGTPALRLNRPSGDSYVFHDSGGGLWAGDADITLRVVTRTLPVPGWDVIREDDAREEYDADGRLLAIRWLDGDVVTFGHDATGLAWVEDRRGRRIELAYSGGRLSGLQLPDGRAVAYGYDQGRLATVARQATDGAAPQMATRSYVYDDAVDPLLLTGIVDENNQRYAAWQYDGEGRVTASRHGGVSSPIDLVQFDYQYGRTTVTSPLGHETAHDYQVRRGLARATASEDSCSSCGGGREASRRYDSRGFVDRVFDFRGVETDYDHSSAGLPTRIVEAKGTAEQRTVQTDWHAQWRLPVERRIRDASNTEVQRQNWTYNARGQVLTASVTDPATSEVRLTTYTWCEPADVTAGTCPLVGLLRSVDGPRTDVSDLTTFAYRMADAPSCAASPTTCPWRKGDLWTVTDPLGHVTEILAHDGAGRVASLVEPSGLRTDFEYHPRGWLAARKVRGADDASEADDRITRIHYDPAGLVERTVDADGVAIDYLYDAAHRLVHIEDSLGNHIAYDLDPAGNRTGEQVRDPGNALMRTLTRVFNTLGELETELDADLHPVDYTYDTNGNPVSRTDAHDVLDLQEFDPLNRLRASIRDVDGIEARTTLDHDVLDQVRSVEDPKGLLTTYTRNGFGEVVALSSPDTGLSETEYDAGGNAVLFVDARGIEEIRVHDAAGRLVERAFSDATPAIQYTYDVQDAACTAIAGIHPGRGRLTALRDESGTTHYCHDRFGRVVRKVQVTKGQSLAVDYAYTPGDRLAAMTYPDGAVVDYVRDALGRIVEIGVTRAGGSREILLENAIWYPFGPVAGWDYGNGRELSRALDQDYAPVYVEDTAPGGLSLGYLFDDAGRLASLHDASLQAPSLRDYDYDAVGRLTSVHDGTTSALLQGYAYDATGNRESATTGVTTTPYLYPTDSHRLAQVGATARTYDAAGNLTVIGGTTHVMTYAGHGRMATSTRGMQPTTAYAYNGLGEQVHRERGPLQRIALYDEAGRWLGDYEGTGTPLQQFVWLDELPVGVLAGAGASQRLHYVQPDALGTPRVVIDPVRDVAVWRWGLEGEAFGNDVPEQDPDQDGVPFVFDMRFPGQRYDAASGLVQNYYREYEALTGRYTQSDPIGLAGGISTYGYAATNPLSYRDPYGLEAIIGPWPIHSLPPWLAGLGRLALYGGTGGVIVGSLLPSDMGYSSCEAAGVDFKQCMDRMYSGQQSSSQRSATQCPGDNSEYDREEGCRALWRSTMETCRRLNGVKRMRCFWAAEENYRQCMNEQ